MTHHEVSANWKGEKFFRLILDWDYDKWKVHLTMPGYIDKALQQFQHPWPTKISYSPFPHMPPKMVRKLSMSHIMMIPTLGKGDQHFIQEVTWTFLYYGRVVDITILMALSAIVAQQVKSMDVTMT